MPYGDKEKQKKYLANWYRSNKERARGIAYGYYRKNKHRIGKKSEEYYRKNRQKILMRQKIYVLKNKENKKKYDFLYYRKNKEKFIERSFIRNKEKYGITISQYQDMLKNQKDRCAICENIFSSPKTGRAPCIDHCHNTKEIRGILCGLCNKGLGLFQDDPKMITKALKYLNKKHEKTSNHTKN